MIDRGIDEYAAQMIPKNHPKLTIDRLVVIPGRRETVTVIQQDLVDRAINATDAVGNFLASVLDPFWTTRGDWKRAPIAGTEVQFPGRLHPPTVLLWATIGDPLHRWIDAEIARIESWHNGNLNAASMKTEILFETPAGHSLYGHGCFPMELIVDGDTQVMIKLSTDMLYQYLS